MVISRMRIRSDAGSHFVRRLAALVATTHQTITERAPSQSAPGSKRLPVFRRKYSKPPSHPSASQS